ncbi:MAG: radical SAM protein [bacterium]
MSSTDPTAPLVCLIRPPGAETFRIGTSTLVPPLGLAYIAAAVEGAGCDVVVLDALSAAPTTHTKYFQGYLVGLPLEEIAARIPEAAFAVGLTCMFTHEWPMLVRLIELIKRQRPDIPVVVGGEHVTAMPEFSLATSQADVLALGEGEETAAELFRALRSGASIDAIDGIAHRRSGEIVVNRRRMRSTALEQIRRPAWHHIDLAAYHEHRFIGGVYSASLTVPMLATRGCPYQCTYCSSPNMWTTKWIPRDPKDVADEIESYVERYGAGNFPFYDLTAVIRKEWIVAFCREIIDRGLQISWQMASGTRSEAIDAEVADLLRRSGMINMAYAPESGSDLTRRYIKKKVSRDKLFASIEAAAQSQLSVAAYIVIGFPHDGRREMRETVAFLREIARRGVNDLGSGYYMALPGTELFRTLYEQGKIVIDRAYFRHILNALSITPATSYSEQMGRAELFYWKVRFVLAFYLSRLRVLGLRSTAAAAQQTVSTRSHSSKLQTALRVSFKNGLATLRIALAGARWMPLSDEKTFFAAWDGIYRDIIRQRRSSGVDTAPPLDARDLQARNYVATLRTDHEASRHLTVPGVAAAPATTALAGS